jgi:multidrug resistance efflux pump
MKKAIYRLLGLAILAAGGWYGYQWYKKLPSHQEQVATAKVQRGDVVIRAFTRGELRAVRSLMLPAPNLNGTVQVTTLAPAGSLANEKDLVVEYDDSELQATLDEDKMGLEQVDEQIKGQKANMAITQSQDQLSLLATQYNVRRAELQVQMNPVIDAIDGKKNLLSVSQTNQSLKQLQEDIKSRQEQADSQLAVLQETRNRSLLNIQRDQQRLANCKSLAPITGLVSIQQNRAGNFNFGQVMPDIREGDTLTPGMPVAQLLDLSEVEVWAKVGELDRANLVEGQEALLQLDSIPDKQFHGTIKTLTGTASADVFSGDPAKKFDVVFSVDMRQLLAGLGMKPADLDRIMATAAANAKKQIGSSASALFASLQGAPGATPEMFGEAGGRGQSAGNDQGGRGRRGGAVGRRGEEAAGRGDGRAGGGRGPSDQAEGQGRGNGSGQPGNGSQGAGRRGGRDTIQALMARSSNPFSDDDRANAKLPLPPEKDSQVQVLLRPGLLADVEIVVEKIPNALHIPTQAVFTKNDRPTVFVQQAKTGKFLPREVQLLKQSESMMVLAGGVQPGEVIALADPTADKNAKKDNSGKKSNGNPMSSMPGGK